MKILCWHEVSKSIYLIFVVGLRIVKGVSKQIDQIENMLKKENFTSD